MDLDACCQSPMPTSDVEECRYESNIDSVPIPIPIPIDERRERDLQRDHK